MKGQGYIDAFHVYTCSIYMQFSENCLMLNLNQCEYINKTLKSSWGMRFSIIIIMTHLGLSIH